MAGLSKNFEVMKDKLEQPSCFGKYSATSKANNKKCGFCWFSHDCKNIKPKRKKTESSEEE